MLFEGSGVAIITPFNDDGSVNYEEYENLLDFHLAKGTDAIIALGTTSEAACLSEEEKLKLVDISVKKLDGHLPLIVGNGSNNTYAAAEFSKKISAIDGVDGLLVVTPYYNKANKEGLYRHFEYIANNSTKPIILYNVPSRTNVNIDIDTLERLAKIDNIVGIKDATGDLAYTTSIRSRLGDDFAIYSGNDDLIVPMLSLGANGVISVLANILPKEVHDMCEYGLRGDFASAAKLQIKLYDLTKALFNEVNPVCVKYAASLLNLCKNKLRLPLSGASDGSRDLIEKALEELND